LRRKEGWLQICDMSPKLNNMVPSKT
jgi:hypothetical protein